MKFIILVITFFLFSISSYSQDIAKNNVEFTSDSLEVDEKKNLMIAKGNVVIKSQNETIKADKVQYDKNLDKALAKGNVLIINDNGSIF